MRIQLTVSMDNGIACGDRPANDGCKIANTSDDDADYSPSIGE